jgi:hypothetical protein
MILNAIHNKRKENISMVLKITKLSVSKNEAIRDALSSSYNVPTAVLKSVEDAVKVNIENFYEKIDNNDITTYDFSKGGAVIFIVIDGNEADHSEIKEYLDKYNMPRPAISEYCDSIRSDDETWKVTLVLINDEEGLLIYHPDSYNIKDIVEEN